MIFSQPFLNGLRPDVVVFNPDIGIMIYEVKDWQLDRYSWEGDPKNKVLHVHDSRGSYPIKNPVSQVDHYARKLREQLVPQIGESADRYKPSYGLVKTGLYFHCASEKEAVTFFAEYASDYRPILGYDSLIADNIELVVPDSKRTSSFYWNKAWNEEALFWLRPPVHSIEQSQPLTLTVRQREHAAPRPGHYRLRGPAGSGKSQVIAYRAGQLAAQNKDVLILTFNITLWHYLRDLIQRTPFSFSWERITFNHFHGFCADILALSDEKWPELKSEDQSDREVYFREVVVAAVRKCVASRNTKRWDAILVDEGQDYCWEWYDLLSSEFLSDRNELLLVCDTNQNIYKRENTWIDGSMRNVQFRGQWRELQGSHRMSKAVAFEVVRFAQTFGLSSTQEITPVQHVDQENFLDRLFDPHVLWFDLREDTSEDAVVEFLWDVFRALKKRKFSPSDIAFLLPTHAIGAATVGLFEKHRIGVNHVFGLDGNVRDKRHKKSFWNGDGRVKMSTIHSFKGWESQCVVMVISDHMASEFESLDMAVYTAMTRAKETLVVVNLSSRYREFGKNISSSW